MVRRRPRWTLIGVIAALTLIGWLQVRHSSSAIATGRALFLHDGLVEIVQVEDAVTFAVRALDGPGREYNGLFRLRLMGVERPIDTDAADRWRASVALEQTNRFLSRCPGRVVEVVFDRQCFDATETPSGYLFSGDKFLNAELLRTRVVRLKRPAGLPVTWMRELIKVAGASNPPPPPKSLTASE